MRLRVTSRYSNGERRWAAGADIEVTDEDGAYLLRDSPGSFVVLGDAPGGDVDSPPSIDRRARGGRVR